MTARPGILLALAVTGCQGPVTCTTSVEPGLVVHVTDALTNLPAAHGATAVAVDGAYEEELRNPAPDDANAEIFYGADEREGTYAVTVTKQGYVDWVREGVRVTGDECHVRTVTLEARLVSSR